jgi:hypothetical protein
MIGDLALFFSGAFFGGLLVFLFLAIRVQPRL